MKMRTIDKHARPFIRTKNIFVRDGKTLNPSQLRELEFILEQQNSNEPLEEGCYKVNGNYATIEFYIDEDGDVII